MANKYKVVAIETNYWKPKDNYIKQIIQAIENIIENGDIITVSEKAISTALGNLIDEDNIKATKFAIIIAKYWMRIIWPYFLGPICHLREKTIQNLRSYPINKGSKHKQLTLERSGFFPTLMHGSEGGIDGSNIPFSYVSLPLKNSQDIANKLCKQIRNDLGKSVTVVIVDTDKTYSLNSFHFTPHPFPVKGIHSGGGVFAYIIGRSLKLKKRATPLAVVGARLSTEEAIEIARIANRARKSGAGKTVWEMAQTFNVNLNQVNWKMLASVRHYPIVILRSKTQMKK